LRFVAIISLATVAVTASSCGLLPANKSKVRSVHQVLDNMNLWNGSVLRVAGYMPSCGGYDCTLFQTKQEHDRFWRVVNYRNSNAELPDFLSIAYDREFDRKAEKLAGRYVVVTGKISTQCRSFTGKPQCLDRASDIIPMDIEPVRV
jgi:hypothetical protein